MYGFGGVGLSEVQISISELSVVGGWWVGGWWTRQTHFMVGPSQGPTKKDCSFFCKIWVHNDMSSLALLDMSLISSGQPIVQC